MKRMEANWKGSASMAPQTMKNGGDQIEDDVRMRVQAKVPPRDVKEIVL